MAIIGVRDLTRQTKSILERVEGGKEPFLITRHGQPIAAIVPVDPAEAERFVLSAAPELLETRRQAEKAGAEGRKTLPLDQVAAQLGVETGAVPDEGEGAGESLVGAVTAFRRFLGSIVGDPLAEEVAKTAEARVAEITSEVVQTAESSGLIEASAGDREELTERVQAVNEELFSKAFGGALVNALVERAENFSPGEPPVESSHGGLLDLTVADEAVEKTSAYVGTLSKRILGLGKQTGDKFSIGTYELAMRSGIGALDEAHELGSLRMTWAHRKAVLWGDTFVRYDSDVLGRHRGVTDDITRKGVVEG